MIIAGNCLFTDMSEKQSIIDNAVALKDIGVDKFRCKIYGGGTSVDKYISGMGHYGMETLEFIDDHIMPTGTEIHTPDQLITYCLSYAWIGARNSANYTLLESFKREFNGDIFIKRGPGMTIDETIGIYDICDKLHGYKPYIIERGILTFDRLPDSRWSPDLKGVIRLSCERPDIFDRLVVDCSHSVFRKEYVKPTYQAFKAIGVKHFMFECTVDGKSKTDQGHMLSVKELNNIING